MKELKPGVEDCIRQDVCNIINKVIYDELCLGKVLQESKEDYKRIILELETRGAQGIVLGCNGNRNVD